LAALVKKYWPVPAVAGTSWNEIWAQMRPYAILGVFSLVVALLVAAAAEFESYKTALLAGFAWDKTLQVAKGV
jgi:hypothetical protein